jgi:hypothetical protein
MASTSLPASRPAEEVSPDELLGGFSHGHLVRWFLTALALHAMVIGGFSVGTIRDWIDPEGAKARKEAMLAAATATADAAAPQGKAPPDAAAADTQPAAPAAEQAADTKPAAAKTPIEKAVSATAKPGEIPKEPDDLGLSIDDTNAK